MSSYLCSNRKVGRFQLLQQENAELKDKIQKIRKEANDWKREKDEIIRNESENVSNFQAMIERAINCEKELVNANGKLKRREIVESANAKLRQARKDPAKGKDIEAFKLENEQLKDQVKMLEVDLDKAQSYRNSVLRKSIRSIQNSRKSRSSSKGGKKNKKIKSKRRHTKKRF
jgi:hypothetical protein